MIVRIETVQEIKNIYRRYLAYMSQFFEIRDYDPWCEGALKNLQNYSQADDRFIYVIKESGAVIGFALVNQHLRFNPDGMAIAEFHILKSHEKKGHGRRLAEHVFAQFPGNWEVAVSLKNQPALAFWEQVVSSYTESHFIRKRNASFYGYGFLFNTS